MGRHIGKDWNNLCLNYKDNYPKADMERVEAPIRNKEMFNLGDLN